MPVNHVAALVLLVVLTSVASAAEDYDTLIQQGLAFRNNGDMVQAEERLRRAYELAEVRTEAGSLLAMVLAFQEKYTEAEQVLDLELGLHPGNPDLMLARARVFSYQGRFAEALEIAEAVRSAGGDAVTHEVTNLTARIAVYARRYQYASELYQSVLQDDPENLEALVGMYDVAMARGEVSEADAYLVRAETVAPGHADVRQRGDARDSTNTISTIKPGPRHELVLGAGRSRFDVSGFPGWRDQFVEYRHGERGSDQWYLRAERSHRFRSRNSYVEAGIVLRNLRLPLELSMGRSWNASFLPEKRFRVATEINLVEGGESWGALVGRFSYQQSSFKTGVVRQLTMQGNYYFRSSESWLSPGVIFTEDESGRHTTGGTLGIHHQATEKLRLGLAATEAAETEGNITTDTRTLHGYLVFRVTDRSSFRVDYTTNDREDSYRRNHLAISYSMRF